MLFEGYCIFGFQEFCKILHCNLVEVNKTMYVKEYDQSEGLLAGVASESVIDLSCRNGVPETEEYCEKVPRSSTRPHVDL